MFTDGSAIASGHCNVISGDLSIYDGKWKHHICRQWVDLLRASIWTIIFRLRIHDRQNRSMNSRTLR
jgi:hypothetical protein